MPNTTVFSPITGAVVPLEQVPDPVFSEHMLGDGLAIDPAGDVVYAPFDGKIIHFNKESHALVVGRDGLEMLIHVGLETVGLKGKFFKVHAKDGDHVKAGQLLIEFDPEGIKNAGYDLITPIVICNTDDFASVNPVAGGKVAAGDKIIGIEKK